MRVKHQVSKTTLQTTQGKKVHTLSTYKKTLRNEKLEDQTKMLLLV